MSLIHNERWKLTATALNGVAIATVVAGGIAPLVAVSFGVSDRPVGGLLAAITAAWFLVGAGLHLLARAILGRLKP